jgi:DNA-binding CsgD family transcriptional regulator
MAVGVRTNYYFKGKPVLKVGATLEEAVRDVIQWWETIPSLVKHEMGNMQITLSFGSFSVCIEVTDPQVIENTRYVGPMVLVEEVASHMDMSKKDALFLLERMSATVEVNTIQVPDDKTAWHVDPGKEPEAVLPKTVMSFVREMTIEADRDARRAQGRVRSPESKALFDLAVRYGDAKNLSDADLAVLMRTSRSTIRDVRHRGPRVSRPSRRLEPSVSEEIIKKLKRSKKSAAEVARSMGMAERTVRELRQRVKEKRKVIKDKDAAKKKLLELVRNRQMTASDAGRELGIAPRTARRWIQDIRREEDE